MSIKHLINEYQPETKEIELGENLKAILIETGFDASYSKAKELLKLLNGALKAKKVEVDDKPTLDLDLDFTAISNNFSSGEMKSIEDFIRKNCRLMLKHNDEWLNVDVAKKEEVDFAFNVNHGQYLPFLIEGVKFHFAKHLPSGNGLLANLANQAVNKLTVMNPNSQ